MYAWGIEGESLEESKVFIFQMQMQLQKLKPGTCTLQAFTDTLVRHAGQNLERCACLRDTWGSQCLALLQTQCNKLDIDVSKDERCNSVSAVCRINHFESILIQLT